MPIYEYVCGSCGAAFERRLKVEERLTPQICPACGHTRGALRMSAPALLGGGRAGEPAGYCPSTGQACGCAHAVRD